MNAPPSERPDWSFPYTLLVVMLAAMIVSTFLFYQVITAVDRRPAGFVGGEPSPPGPTEPAR